METSRIVDPEEPAAAGSAQRVLLVDDSPVVRCFVAAHLRRAGYAVLEAVDGAEALEAFRREPVHVVITDVGMPGSAVSSCWRRCASRRPCPR